MLLWKKLKKNKTREVSHKYYKTEYGGIVRLTNNVWVYSLDNNGEWVRNQDAISMFVDGMKDYWEISEEEVNTIIQSLQEVKNDSCKK